MTRTFSAPGKLVLCGEYAVLDGRAAIVAAVDRRATVTVEDAAELRVRGSDPQWLSVTSRLLDDGSADQPLLVAVLQEARRRGLPLPNAHISVSTTAFSASAGKLGLGSSAAAAVALAAVFAGPAVDAIHALARAAHHAFQGGGSGIDVAASSYGGVLRFQGGSAAPTHPLPASLAVLVAWTGVSAKTQGFVDAWRALPDRRAHLEALDAATARFTAGCAAADGAEVMRAAHDARVAMQAMGRAAGIDVVTDEHVRIAELARAAGGQAKPSGAGGGDIAVCFAPQHARAHLASALEAAGFPVVDLQLGAAGVRVDENG